MIHRVVDWLYSTVLDLRQRAHLVTLLLSQEGEEDDLGGDDNRDEELRNDSDGGDLGVEGDEALPGGAGEGPPGLSNGRVAPVAGTLKLEGAVEGNDCLLALRQQGRLAAVQDDVGGDGDEQRDQQLHERDGEHLEEGVGSSGELGGAFLRDAHGGVHRLGDGKGKVGGQRGNDGRQGGCAEGGLEAGEAAPEAVRVSGGDDDVDPDGGKLQGGQLADEHTREGREEGHGGKHRADDDTGREARNEGTAQTLEERPEAAFGVEQTEGSLDVGRDRPGPGADGLLSKPGHTKLLIGALLLQRNGFVGRGWRVILDNRQDGEDGVQRVTELRTMLVRGLLLMQLKLTYED